MNKIVHIRILAKIRQAQIAMISDCCIAMCVFNNIILIVIFDLFKIL
jgi:hypothetical protein